jgi:hypothetical protein
LEADWIWKFFKSGVLPTMKFHRNVEHGGSLILYFGDRKIVRKEKDIR